MKEYIKDFYNKVIGSIETLPNGNKIARDFYSKILGYYDKSQNITKTFMGKVIAKGDLTAGLIWQNNDLKRK